MKISRKYHIRRTGVGKGKVRRNPKLNRLSPSHFRDIAVYLSVATNKQLYQIQEMVEKEIRLSETSIHEGFERRK